MITYGAIHQRVRYNWGRATKCELCKKKNCTKYEWANKNHKYFFIKKDWFQACTLCHRRYDAKKFGKHPAWNKGDKGLKEYHNITGLSGGWNKGIRSRKEVRCGHCRKKFYPPKRSSIFCSKSCAMFGNKRASVDIFIRE